ncbi:MAG: mobile mystery protein B [Chitinophagaceae bacterium]|nr:MAG: mobile mystery protein B [Chitinophagaceae bacterium]
MGLVLQYGPGQTPLSEEEKGGLLISGVSQHGELDEHEQLNIEQAVLWSLSKKKAENILSEQFIKLLHKKMFGTVWDWAGTFRKSEKNIGIKWINITIELKKLLLDVLFWIENNTYVPAEIAIRFKHRLVCIHCFPNGNGRHSRLMADILLTALDNGVFTWGQSKMNNPDNVRKEYISALKKADNGNIEPLISFAKN